MKYVTVADGAHTNLFVLANLRKDTLWC